MFVCKGLPRAGSLRRYEVVITHCYGSALLSYGVSIHRQSLFVWDWIASGRERYECDRVTEGFAGAKHESARCVSTGAWHLTETRLARPDLPDYRHYNVLFQNSANKKEVAQRLSCEEMIWWNGLLTGGSRRILACTLIVGCVYVDDAEDVLKNCFLVLMLLNKRLPLVWH